MTAKVCIVIGTPRGMGMEICAMITVTAVHRATAHKSCTEALEAGTFDGFDEFDRVGISNLPF